MTGRYWSGAAAAIIAVCVAATPVYSQPAPCPPAATNALAEIDQRIGEWRQEAFDKFRHRVVNADLAGATPASDPVVITGGLSDDKTTAKAQAAVGFAGAGTASVMGSLSSPSAKSIDLLDPLHAATDYSSKFTLAWSTWKNVLSDRAALRATVCDAAVRRGQTQPSETAGSAASALVAEQRARVAVTSPIVASVSFEAGRSTFAFADSTNNYQRATEQHAAKAVSGTAGYVVTYATHQDDISTFLLTYQRRWGYVAGSDTTQFYCHPLPLSTATSCDTTALPDAPPKSKPTNLLQFEARHFFTWPIAPGVRITRNATAAFDTFEAPVYFISKSEDAKFSFTGGVTVGYRDGGTSKGRFVAIFFGTTARPVPK